MFVMLHKEVSVSERVSHRNILLMLLFCCSEDISELSTMFHLKLNAT